MRINLMYIVVPAALAALIYSYRDIQGQSSYSFFGTAETDPRKLSLDVNVWVDKVMVSVGSEVKTGDTLAVFSRNDLVRMDLATQLVLREESVQLAGQENMLASEKLTLRSQWQSELGAIDAGLRSLLVSDSLDRAYRRTVLGKDPGPGTEAMVRKKMLEEQRAGVSKIYEDRLAEIETRLKSFRAMASERSRQRSRLNQYDQQERTKLYLISPVSGYVDNVSVIPGNPAEAFTELVGVTPMAAGRVTGFIPEQAVVPFHISDSVDIESVARPGVKSPGLIISASPSLVEMPLRLRKFIEVRAWGREVQIFLPQDNRFYIGEKLNVYIRRN